MAPGSHGAAPLAARLVDLHLLAVGELPHRVERSGDDLIAFLQARDHLEEAFAGDADLDRYEYRSSLADREYTLCLLARLSRGRLGGRHAGLNRRATPAADGRRLVNE